jgi:hypothetical protein
MDTYSWAWLPVAFVLSAAVALTNFFFAMLALVVLVPVLLAALVALAGAIVAAPYLLGRSVVRHWHRSAVPQPTVALMPVKRHNS